MSYMSIAYSIPNILGLIVMILWGRKISINLRVLVSYSVALFAIFAIPIMGFCGIETNRSLGLFLTLSFLVLMAFAASVLQGSLIGFAGIFPPHYMTAMMSGNGAAGLIVALLRVITKLTLEKEQPSPIKTLTLSASIYFFLSCTVILICILSFIVVLRTEFAQYYIAKSTAVEYEPLQEESVKLETSGVKNLLYQIWPQALLLWFTFTTTFAAFPGITLSSRIMTWEWFPIIMNVTFNLFDFIGRSLPGFQPEYINNAFDFEWIPEKVKRFYKHMIGIPCILRVICVLLFVFCINPKLFGHISIPIANMVAFAFTNGFVSTLLMMIAPQEVGPCEREAAGTFMSFSLVFGIFSGSMIGTGLGYLI
jgi:equilibrative nucleoside transporter 1/2/3